MECLPVSRESRRAQEKVTSIVARVSATATSAAAADQAKEDCFPLARIHLKPASAMGVRERDNIFAETGKELGSARLMSGLH